MHNEGVNSQDIIAADDLVTLRRFRLSDLEQYRHWLQPEHEWHDWDGPYYERATSREIDAAVERLARTLTGDPLTAVPQRAVIVSRADDARILGTVSWYWESEETNWRRMGIALYDPAVRGQGIGSRAFRLWTDYLFRLTDVVRLDFATWSGNAGMLGVGRSLGFVEEGRFRRARIVRGTHYDSVVMGVLREEWEAPTS